MPFLKKLLLLVLMLAPFAIKCANETANSTCESRQKAFIEGLRARNIVTPINKTESSAHHREYRAGRILSAGFIIVVACYCFFSESK